MQVARFNKRLIDHKIGEQTQKEESPVPLVPLGVEQMGQIDPCARQWTCLVHREDRQGRRTLGGWSTTASGWCGCFIIQVQGWSIPFAIPAVWHALRCGQPRGAQ